MPSESSQDIRKHKAEGARTSPTREGGLGAGKIKNPSPPQDPRKKTDGGGLTGPTISGWGRTQRGPPTHSRDRHTLARRDNWRREFRAQMVNNKPNSILQFSGTPATGFLGRLGGQASSPISCCCNDMLSLDCRLEGAPSVPKSCKKWRFSSRIRAFVHYADLAVLGLELARHRLL